MDGRAAQPRIAGPIECRPPDLDEVLRRLRALDPAAVARAVPRSPGGGEVPPLALLAALLARRVRDPGRTLRWRPAIAAAAPGSGAKV